jgi:ankyrin repeat protein
LLEVNSKTNITNKSGFTPLHLAASTSKNGIASILLKKGADVNAAPNDLPFRTALFDAINNNHKMMVQILIQYNARVNLEWLADHSILKEDISSDEELYDYINSFSENARFNTMSLLHVAASKKGRAELVKTILTFHPEVINSKDIDGNTLLHIAAKKQDLPLIHVLIDAKADVSAINNADHKPLDETRNKSIKQLLTEKDTSKENNEQVSRNKRKFEDIVGRKASDEGLIAKKFAVDKNARTNKSNPSYNFRY